MMNRDEARAEVVRHLLDASDRKLRPEDVTEATRLREDLDLSSLQAVTLVMDLEEGFGIAIEDEEILGLKSVRDVLDIIEAKHAAQSAAEE